jgi:hypothetical protein
MKGVQFMTRTHRILAVSLACAMLLSGFAVGRYTHTGTPSAAAETKSALNAPAATPENQTEQAFYLKDFKTGYADGYNAALTNQTTNIVNTDRQGYNDGFKQGYAAAYQPVQATATQLNSAAAATPVGYHQSQRVIYQRVPVRTKRHKNSKLKTVLTIAAPAAIGAGVGALVGGGKGAGVGALLGGGGGAAYHLYKNRKHR